jgi:intracellular septation protein
MKLFNEFLPILAFFIAFKAFDIYVATGVAIGITLLQMAWLVYKNKPITKMQIFNGLIILVFGGLTIFLHDKMFIMMKPTILYWGFALALAISMYIFKKNLIEMILGKEIEFQGANPNNIWSKINLSWIMYFAFLGGLNLYIANNYSEEIWVNFKLSTIGFLLVFIILQGLWMSKYIKNKPSEES